MKLAASFLTGTDKERRNRNVGGCSLAESLSRAGRGQRMLGNDYPPKSYCLLSGVSKYTAIGKETSPVLHQWQIRRAREQVSSQSAMPLATGGKRKNLSHAIEFLLSQQTWTKSQELGWNECLVHESETFPGSSATCFSTSYKGIMHEIKQHCLRL